MRPRSARARITLACLVFFGGGLLASRLFRTVDRAVPCDSPRLHTYLCAKAQGYSHGARIVISLGLLALAVGVALLVAVWTQRPLVRLTQMARRLGPLNLSERSGWRSRDEAGQLARELDAMMDRVAAGYEGQRSFAANASHELRTPLAVQRTLIEVSMGERRTPAQLALLTEQLLRANERNERLIEGLLVLSEAERGLVGRTPCRLDEIAGDVVETLRDTAGHAQVRLSVELAPCPIDGEAVLLERLVLNLVRNAITYNHKDGDVAVVVGREPALRVVNSGPPIDTAEAPALFEPFRRGSGDRLSQGDGAGLGLAIVRSIAQAHGGSVSATPNGPGGLVVDVRLPVA